MNPNPNRRLVEETITRRVYHEDNDDVDNLPSDDDDDDDEVDHDEDLVPA